MHSPIHKSTVDLLLSAMFQGGVYGITSSFMYGKPGTPDSQRRLGMSIWYRYGELVRTALYVRQNGPSYMRHLAIDEIEGMLINFISENY